MKIPAISRLLRTANKSNLKRARHATLILRGSVPLAIGYNHDDVHSEVNALEKLWPNKRKGVTIVNIRITGGNRVGLSKPCDMCYKYLKYNKVKTIYYTDKLGMWVKI